MDRFSDTNIYTYLCQKKSKLHDKWINDRIEVCKEASKRYYEWSDRIKKLHDEVIKLRKEHKY